MPNPAELERRIREHRPLQLSVPWADEVIYPYYDGLSIYNVAQTIAALLGASAEKPLDSVVWDGDDPTGQVDRVVLLITDGLGYRLLTQMIAEEPEVAALVADITQGRAPLPLTSVSPSTTACALPTLWTAATPGTHGMLGTRMYLREFDALADMLYYTPVSDPNNLEYFAERGMPGEDFIQVSSLASMLKAVDVPTHLLIAYDLTGTGLSRQLHRGIEHHHPHMGISDVWLRLRDVLRLTYGERCCVSAYLPNVDTLAHAYGHDSEYVRREIRWQLQGLQEVLAMPSVQDGRTLLMVIADHGHHDALEILVLNDDPRLQTVKSALRMAPSGDERFTYLYVKEGERAQVEQVLMKEFSEQLAIIEPEAAIQAGLFGVAAHPDLPSRIGDLIVTSRLNTRLVERSRSLYPVSVHAGLSDWEMLVPLLWRRF